MSIEFHSVGTTVQSAGATTLTPLLTVPAGMLGARLAVVVIKSNAAISTATPGWTLLSQTNNGASLTMALFIGTPVAANPVFTWAGSVGCGALQIFFQSPTNNVVTNAVGASATNTGTGNPHTVASITATRDRGRAVYVNVGNANTALGAPGAPWTEHFDGGSGTGTYRIVIGSRTLAASGDLSGSLSMTGGTSTWIMRNVELLTEATPADLGTAELEVSPWSEVEGASLKEVELGLWVNTAAGLETSEVELVPTYNTATSGLLEMEIAAWLAPAVAATRRRPLYLS